MGYNLGIKLSNMIFTREINLLCSKIITVSKANHNECDSAHITEKRSANGRFSEVYNDNDFT